MLHINHKTFYATLPVHLTCTNELQLHRRPSHRRIWRCASRAPTNYNLQEVCQPVLFILVRLARTHELQRVTSSASTADLNGCASRAPTNYNPGSVASMPCCLWCASRAPTNYNLSAQEVAMQHTLVRLTRTNELQPLLLQALQCGRDEDAPRAHP